MDERTEQQKLDDTAARSEIGERAGTVLVIAPSHREAQEWAAEHGIPYSRTVFVGPTNYDHALRGRHGTPHVIVRWYAFSEETRVLIKNMLLGMQSPGWEDPDAGRVAEPVAVRAGGVG